MILVSTSRKPLPEVRTFSKDLAFALGGRYAPRGKTGMYDITDAEATVLLVSRQGGRFCIDVYAGGTHASGIAFSTFRVEQREGVLAKGLRTGNQTVYESLQRYVDIIPSDEGAATLSFDGAQKRRYVLELEE
ncbi:MAG: hypothetical protein GKC04_00105 [Methanomicrobiales archaeon]|nr:hypothetical protein [Methanomicrobiales archaeon]